MIHFSAIVFLALLTGVAAGWEAVCGNDLESKGYVRVTKPETIEAKEMLARSLASIQTRNRPDTRQAIQFFHDIRASAVLAELLKNNRHWSDLFEHNLSEAFRTTDLLAIYTNFARPWPYSASDLGGGAGFLDVVYRLNHRIEVVVRLRPDVDTPMRENPSWFKYDINELRGFREAFQEILQTAVKKKTLDKPLDDLIETIRETK